MSDKAAVQVMQRLGVDYSQAILSTKQFAKEVTEADIVLKKLQQTATKGVKVKTDARTDAMGQIRRDTESATQATQKHVKTVKDLNKEYSVFGSMAERRLSWFISGTALFGGAAAIRQAVTTLTQVESDMTTIARITEDVTFNFKEMRDELQQLGVTYGMVWENTSDIAIRWSQAGYNIADTLELTKTSLLALNTAELDANYATQGLIAVMAQWGLEAEGLLPVVDKINITADNFAVDTLAA